MKRRSLLKTFAASATCAGPLSQLLAQSAMAQADRPIRTLFIYHPNVTNGMLFFEYCSPHSYKFD